MIRLAVLCIAALCASACAGSGLMGAQPESPAWLEERVAQADREHAGYLEISELPDRSDAPDNRAAHERNARQLIGLRDSVLNDPAFENPDADVDAEAIGQRSRERAEREAQRAQEED